MVPDGFGTGRGREDKRAAMEQVIWESFLMRRARDLERLWRGDQAGDPICRNTHNADPRFASDMLILTGICWRCAEKSDAELLKYGSELTAQLLRGRVQGFKTLCSQEAH